MVAMLGARLEDRDFERIERLEASLARHLESADRLDLVAEQFDPHRLVPIRGEHIDDPAANRKLAGKLHGRRVLKTVGRDPAEQLVDIDDVADTKPAASAPRAPWAMEPVAAGSGST